jgi:hypothetical protein
MYTPSNGDRPQDARRFGRTSFKQSIRIVIVALLFYISLIVFSNVETALTNEDREAFLSEGFRPLVKPANYIDQIKQISDAHKRVIEKFPAGEGIPLFEEREPTNLNSYRRGLCYDRARYLDKLLQFKGFETRHVYLLYRTGKGFVASMFSKGHPSHAVTQVLTVRGWLTVDSNSSYLALGEDGNPLSMEQLTDINPDLPESFRREFWPIIGLYSRSGAHYKPYLPVPEVNLSDFLANFY